MEDSHRLSGLLPPASQHEKIFEKRSLVRGAWGKGDPGGGGGGGSATCWQIDACASAFPRSTPNTCRESRAGPCSFSLVLLPAMQTAVANTIRRTCLSSHFQRR